MEGKKPAFKIKAAEELRLPKGVTEIDAWKSWHAMERRWFAIEVESFLNDSKSNSDVKDATEAVESGVMTADFLFEEIWEHYIELTERTLLEKAVFAGIASSLGRQAAAA